MIVSYCNENSNDITQQIYLNHFVKDVIILQAKNTNNTLQGGT